MQHQNWTAQSIKAHRTELKRRVSELVPIKESVLKEAYAAALDFRTEAALLADLKLKPELSARPFNEAAFANRIAQLTDDLTADIVTKILGGVELSIEVAKYSAQRQRADKYSDSAYDVNVKLSGVSTSLLGGEINFHVPEFGRDVGAEPYRVDSAHDRRAQADYEKTRFGAGRGTLVAKLVDGQWHGAFFVYAAAHQADDTQCIRSLRAALARAILPQLPTRARCSIFRPDKYQIGAWRVEVRLSEGLKQFWGGSLLLFGIPQLPKRFFIMESEFRADLHLGRFVDGVWAADLYTNGIEEANNPTSVAAVKRALLEAVDEVALRAGFRDEGVMTPIFGEEGKVIGTVQVRNGLFETWNRIRMPDRAGNIHKFLGRFATLNESESAIRSSM